jgi:hypothetical protein
MPSGPNRRAIDRRAAAQSFNFAAQSFNFRAQSFNFRAQSFNFLRRFRAHARPQAIVRPASRGQRYLPVAARSMTMRSRTSALSGGEERISRSARATRAIIRNRSRRER